MRIRTGIGHCWIEFDNGYTLSIFNGMGSYTENGEEFKRASKIMKDGDILATWESKDVEIAIMDENDNFITDKILNNGDDVMGHVSIQKLLDIINELRDKYNG